ncbi:ATP-binding protein [Alkalinema sp. FACHB-956]|uniref:ATP-binding protein n=1 Tax=Alkalinema sp. FACHB-956 TaxID=2692768 RepID=UPI001681D4D0|nr:ATP-binding protein [Alkalinema sp. FACHB-956]MBD2325775.1 HAMP domain-containing protein [Alkalinema sp. FACHB-956]
MTILLIGSLAIGYWLTQTLEEQRYVELKDFAQRVQADLQANQAALLAKAQVLADQPALQQAVESQDRSALMQILIPTKAELKLDWIKVINTQSQSLVDLTNETIQQKGVLDPKIFASAAKGVTLDDWLSTPDNSRILGVVTVPIKTKTLMGGLVLGQEMTEDSLTHIAQGSSKQIIVISGPQVAASMVGSLRDRLPFQPLPQQRVKIQGQTFLTVSFDIPRLSDQPLTGIVLSSTQPLEAAKQTLWLRLLGVLVLGGTLITLLGLRIAEMIVRPITALTQATQSLAEGNLDRALPVDRSDEVGKLSNAFNQMAEQLRHLFSVLEASNSQLEQRVEERTQELSKAISQLKQTQAQMIQAEKMSSLGKLVAGIAHEINNPVTFIYGNLEHLDPATQRVLELIDLYQQYYPQAPPEIEARIAEIEWEYLREDIPAMLNSMRIGSQRIREIVLSLRNFSRLDEAETKWADIHQGLESTLLILRHRLNATPTRPQIEVERNYGELPPILCHPGLLNQVFLNILTNAIDALEDRLKNDPSFTRPYIFISTGFTQRNRIKIVIADNGPGIPEDIQSQIFDPFFTTKPVGQGTGMGMSISYQIITEKHHGNLICRSTPGNGCEFKILLPYNPQRTAIADIPMNAP